VRYRSVVAAQRAGGPDHDVLSDVLGLLLAVQHASDVAADRAAMAAVQFGERLVDARAKRGDELVVGQIAEVRARRLRRDHAITRPPLPGARRRPS
jgi:hypothetical protein